MIDPCPDMGPRSFIIIPELSHPCNQRTDPAGDDADADMVSRVSPAYSRIFLGIASILPRDDTETILISEYAIC